MNEPEKLPHHLTLELTRQCNFACPFCYCVWHEKPELARRSLPMTAWKKIVRHVLACGVNDLLFTGGEALLRPETPELAAYARRLAPEARLALFTNGSRLTEPLIRRFKRLKVRLATSLQGLATYGAMTGTKRRCTDILTKIARAKELGWPLEVSITVTGANKHEFADIFCAAAYAGASGITAGAVMLEGRARHRDDLALTREEWLGLKNMIRALPDCGVPYSFCNEMICECRDHTEEEKARYGDPAWKPCPAGRDFGVIGPSGYLRACLHTPVNLRRIICP